MFLIQLPIVLLFMVDIHLKEVPGILGHHGFAQDNTEISDNLKKTVRITYPV